MPEETAEPHRERKDHGLRWLFSALPNPSPRIFGVRCRGHMDVLSPVIPLLETKAVVVDGLLRDPKDGSIWSLEFEMSNTPDFGRLIEHHVAVARAYPGCRIETVAFWGRLHSTQVKIQCGHASLKARQVALPTMDGATALQAVRERVKSRLPLQTDDILLLATLPLMRHGMRMWTVLEQAAPLTEALDPELRRGVVTAMGSLAYSALDPAERPFLLEVLRQMPAGQELFEDLRREGRQEGLQEGRHEGALATARQAVLDAFEARFDGVPEAVRDAVHQTGDPDRLNRWLRAVVRARDAAAAQQAVCGEH